MSTPEDRTEPRRQSFPRPSAWKIVLVSVVATALFAGWEMHTSTLQSRWFSSYARQLRWDVREGACPEALVAPHGPYDLRLGYARLQHLQAKLTARDFRVERQACPSPELAKLVRRGIAPPYDEKHAGALVILDRDSKRLYAAPLDRYAFDDYSELPALLVQSLLFVEDRELLDSGRRNRNPAVEWDRLFFAGTNYALDKVVDHGRVQGGSTLATQIEKFRHSPEGRTASGTDKARQIFGASLRAYRVGTDTRAARREIVLDYLNSMPLGAALREGEVTGLGQGMSAWFDKTPADVIADLTLPEEDRNLERKAQTYKQALALIMATRRPALYLSKGQDLLEERIRTFLPLLVEEGIVSERLAEAVIETPVKFRDAAPARKQPAFVDRKATNAVRAELLDLLSVDDLYALDRLDLRVQSSIDSKVQVQVTSVLRKLQDRDYLARKGFYGKHLLESDDDPGKIVCSFSLYEVTDTGNRLRVSADNLDKPLDINRGVKLEMGSTAKLRTMANYLMIVAELQSLYRSMPGEALLGVENAAQDPISRWTAGWMRMHPGASRDELLEASLSRPFATDTGEGFFTGSGLHYFSNFDDEDMPPDVTLRNAFQHSINLVYIRLMREIVEYYTAQLDYDKRAILADSDHPQRRALLDAAMDHEAVTTLRKFYNQYRGKTWEQALHDMCGREARGLRRLAITVLAERPETSFAELRALARQVYPQVTAAQDSLLHSYHRTFAGKARSSQDEGYLLGRHPLEVWMVRDKRDHPTARWPEVLDRSAEARRASSQWIFPRRFKEAQNLRIRSELERRAFGAIHASWQRLGYPFPTLVPSLATAIGSSGDRPQALAELVGIIQRDGRRVPFLRVDALHFGEGTPYETHFAPARGPGEQVMPPEVAAALQGLMHAVVEGGTAQRVRGALTQRGGKAIPIGGKTGSGDNRRERFNASGGLIASTAINRTASFVFTIGDRYFGMVSAYVFGADAGDYSFTSSLALQAFRTLAPTIEPMVRAGESGERTTASASAPVEDDAAPAAAVAATPPAAVAVAAGR